MLPEGAHYDIRSTSNPMVQGESVAEPMQNTHSVEEFREQMESIYTTTANEGSIDECPMVYKAPDDIISLIGDTVSIKKSARPVYNFKACN